MNKTISIQAHDRPKHLLQVLSFLRQCECVNDWDIYGFVDAGSDKSSDCFQILKNSKIVKDAKLYEPNKGMREANTHTYKIMFEDIESDYNFHCEEDILVGPDSLKYFDWAYTHFDENCQVATLWNPAKINQESDKVGLRSGFACWGWTMTSQFYFNHAKPALKNYDPNRDGWAINIFRRIQNKDMYELFPYMRRSKNIGIDSGVHDSASFDNPLLGDMTRWTGEKFEPSFEYKNVGRSDIAKSIDGVK